MTRRLIVTVFLIVIMFCAFISKDKQHINVVFIGDSITAGPSPDVSPPKFACEYLKEHLSPGIVQVSNMGLSGYTTVNFLPGHPTFANVKVAADLFYADYRSILLFSIMLGANDSAIQGPAGSPVIPSDYRANLKTMADSLIAAYPNCKIVINYPIWYSEKTHNRGASYLIEGQKRVILYQKEIDTLVDLYQGLKPGHVFMGDKKAYTYFKKNFLTDLNEQTGPDGIYYLHPNEKGDRALAGFWCKAILKALQ